MIETYRELSIQPALTGEVQADVFQFDLHNTGLGPARIHRVAFKDHAACIYLENASRPNEETLFKIVRGIGDYFSEPFKVYLQSSVWEPIAAKVRVETPVPGEIIPAGGHFTVFGFEEHQLETLKDRMAKSSTDVANGMVMQFSHLGLTLPLYVEYCSLTDYFCRNAEQIRDHCK